MSRADWTMGKVTVTSWGNGLAYTLTHADGRTVYMQGDEANAWRDGYELADATDEGAESYLLETIADQGAAS